MIVGIKSSILKVKKSLHFLKIAEVDVAHIKANEKIAANFMMKFMIKKYQNVLFLIKDPKD